MNFCSSPFSREQNQIFFLFTIPDRSQALPRYQMSHPWSLMLRHQSLAFRGSLISRPKCENETHKEEAGAGSLPVFCRVINLITQPMFFTAEASLR